MASELTLRVSELFYSLQGESTFAGLPCVFIRLSGCNLRCSYCDAAYTYNEEGEEMNLATIIAFVERYPRTLVEITGGEPLLQQNVYPLMIEILLRRRQVLLETNGSLPLDAIPDDVHAIVDIKCPGSGMSASWLPGNLNSIRGRARRRPKTTEIKFVIRDMADYRFAREFTLAHDLAASATVLFSPVRHTISLPVLAEAILQDGLPVRLQVQLHTIIWPEISRGV